MVGSERFTVDDEGLVPTMSDMWQTVGIEWEVRSVLCGAVSGKAGVLVTCSRVSVGRRVRTSEVWSVSKRGDVHCGEGSSVSKTTLGDGVAAVGVAVTKNEGRKCVISVESERE